jgi:Ion channel
MLETILCFIGGAILIVVVVNDVFQSVIVPRAVGKRFRISFLLYRASWMVWPRLASSFYGARAEDREDFLALYAPFTLVVLLLVWTACAILGYALLCWAFPLGFAPPLQSFGNALYFAATALTTLGFGDVVGNTAAPRIISIFAAITGLALLSITTAYFFALFGSFQSREQFVVTVGARAGSPASGVNLLAIAAYSETEGDLNGLMLDAQRWAASVMESHLAYPTLAYFRSSHEYESWVGTLGTLLDASVLLMTTVDIKCGQARIFFNIGRHAARDLKRYFGLDRPEPSVDRSEFDHACDRLQAAGFTIKPRDEAWERFKALRTSYAGNIDALAHYFQIPPLQWIGDRSAISREHHATSSTPH